MAIVEEMLKAAAKSGIAMNVPTLPPSAAERNRPILEAAEKLDLPIETISFTYQEPM